jgi:hypothetical protein
MGGLVYDNMEAETFASILKSDAPPLVMFILGAMLIYAMIVRNSNVCVAIKKEEDIKVDVKPPIKIGITHVVIRPTNGVIHAHALREVDEDR